MKKTHDASTLPSAFFPSFASFDALLTCNVRRHPFRQGILAWDRLFGLSDRLDDLRNTLLDILQSEEMSSISRNWVVDEVPHCTFRWEDTEQS